MRTGNNGTKGGTDRRLISFWRIIHSLSPEEYWYRVVHHRFKLPVITMVLPTSLSSNSTAASTAFSAAAAAMDSSLIEDDNSVGRGSRCANAPR